ncbi:MAG TPA: T4 RnlA family RNA ligase [Saprospiraceae bacterium]|nr:T4 RnlA family RNA ligase [Saprospiraceae bacterium]
MTNLPFTIDTLEEMISSGYVRMTKHPERPLYIYNYTAKAQYEYMWNEVTMLCRGLILDENYTIVARPFTKFFNYGEVPDQQIPSLPFEVYDKMDGSLGILYWWNDRPYIATRGSFMSEQAIKATELLYDKYAKSIDQLDKTKTYLFEIIYPENRIVIDYGYTEELVLLAIVDIASGIETPLTDIGFPVVKRYDGLNDLQAIRQLQMNDKEGFIIRFENGFRIKIKFAEYVRLHRIITQVSSKTIWEHLRDNQSMDELLDKVPDEFYNWVRTTIDDFWEAYRKIEAEAKAEYKELEDRKTTAFYFQKCQHPAILFKMYEKRSYDAIIWKLLKPKYERPFRNIEIEE